MDGAAIINTASVAVRQAGNTTYAPKQTTQNFAVSKKSNSIDTSSIVGTGIIDDVRTLTAPATSDLPVTFVIDTANSDAGVATLAGNVLTLTGAGTVRVLARAGNDLWKAAADTPIDITVAKKTARVSYSPTKENFANTPRVIS